MNFKYSFSYSLLFFLGAILIIGCKKDADVLPPKTEKKSAFFIEGTLNKAGTLVPFSYAVGIDSGIIASTSTQPFSAYNTSIIGHIGHSNLNLSIPQGDELGYLAGISLHFILPIETASGSSNSLLSKTELLSFFEGKEMIAFGNNPGEAILQVNPTILNSPFISPLEEHLGITGSTNAGFYGGMLTIEELTDYSWRSLDGITHSGLLIHFTIPNAPLEVSISASAGPHALQNIEGQYFFEYQP